FFYWLRLGGGVFFLLGLVTYLSSFFIGGELPVTVGGGNARPVPAQRVKAL
ncbi:MAG: hypothetical protein V4532_13230, partial [Pseudomonadota bacterium]